MLSACIAEEIRRRITSGELKPGDRVPSARQITQHWGVAIATASKALAMLRAEGLVRAVPGIGTVVDQALSQQRIVAAALAIADSEGLAAVSMRRVAHELGVATMSLYRYVPGKDDLVMLIADAAFAEDQLPATPPFGWRARLEVVARLQWKIYHKHPWLAGAMSITRPQLVANGMAHTEWTLQAIDGLRLSPEMSLVVALTVIGYVRGVAVSLEMETQAEQDTGLSNDAYMTAQEAQFRAVFAGGAFPTLARVSAQPEIDLGLDTLFEFGLARLLDGLATFLGAG
jgi:DNA-binding transcriptional regulator YhcF (GntR family)